jgi:outer membrane receptor protein involved in Fe transport
MACTASTMFLLPGAVWISQASAEEPAKASELMLFTEIPIVTVASSSEKETVFNSVSTVSVIDRDMLEKYHFATVSEALSTVAGIMVTRTYFMDVIPTARGILQENFTNKVLIMINNIPAWNPITGEGNVDRVGINDVERIEVLKGPASVLYGSNAFTGAINIVLKKPQKDQEIGLNGGFGSGEGGFNGIGGSYQAGGHYACHTDDFSFFASANALNQIGSDYALRTEDKKTVNIHSYYNPQNLTTSSTYKNHTLLFNSSSINENFLGNKIDVADGLMKNMVMQGNLLNYTYDFAGEKLSFLDSYDLKYSLTYDWQRRNFARTADDDTHSDVVGSRTVNSLDINTHFFQDWNFELGGDTEYLYSRSYMNYLVLENQTITDNNMSNISKHESSVFSQLGYKWDNLKTLIGSRYTYNPGCESNVSSRGSVVYSFNDVNSVKLIAGQSFRTPSLFEINPPSAGLTTFGDPNLKPETSNSVELDYDSKIGDLFVQADAYYATYNDLITRVQRTITYQGHVYPNATVYTNDNPIFAKGIELETKYTLPSTQVFLTGNYILGSDGDRYTDSATGIDTYNFKYVPTTVLSAGFIQTLGPCFLSAYGNFYTTMMGAFNNEPAQYDVNATLGYKMGIFTHYLTVNNLGNNTVLVPEYVRRRVTNDIPLDNGVRVNYSFTLEF